MLKVKTFKLLGAQTQHSLSPLIHGLFAQQLGLEINYELLDIDHLELSAAITSFFNTGGTGLNITAPYKEVVFKQLDHLTLDAQIAKAVNTVWMQNDGRLCGANTDGIGLIYDFMRNDIQITDKNIIILGAGGAVRGILPQIIALKPKSINVFNNNQTRAELLKQDFSTSKIAVHSYTDLPRYATDVVLHAISSNMHVLSLYSFINFKNTICYDLNYDINSSIFLDIAQANGAKRVLNGLGMLVEQAAAAFKIWHNCTPEVTSILSKIQRMVNKK